MKSIFTNAYAFRFFILIGFLLQSSTSIAQSNLSALFRSIVSNKNVYKTKIELKGVRVYQIWKYKGLFKTGGVVSVPAAPINSIISPSPGNFIRYQIMLEDGNYVYIRVLPGCIFNGNNIIYVSPTGIAPPAPVPPPPAQSTTLVTIPTTPPSSPKPEDFYLRVLKTELEPNNRYLASSMILGKLMTLPMRVRKEKWDTVSTTVVQGSLSIGYSFGWKVKLGNNPYKNNYLNLIPYALGISGQKYFAKSKSKNDPNRDTITAKSDEFALTYLSFGLAYETDKFNIGIFMGKDKMFGRLDNWIYQDKWWWGIGIGYELFK